MPLELALLSDADITDFVEAEAAAMKSYPYAQALAVNLPKGVSRLDDVRATFKQGDETIWLKVTDEGKLIAGAIWLYQFGTKEMPTVTDGPAIPPPAFEAERIRRGEEYNAKFRTGPHASTYDQLVYNMSLVLTRLEKILQLCLPILTLKVEVPVVCSCDGDARRLMSIN